MTGIHFNNTDEFLQTFALENDNNYERITPLKDRKVAFSVQRQYPENIRFKPPRTKNGVPDVVALIFVWYTHPDESDAPFKSQKVPIDIRTATHSRYTSQHFDYNFEDENCPTKESVERAKSTPRPVSLDYLRDFYYDHDRNLFIDQSNNSYSGSKLLNKVFDDHCNTIHIIKGLRLQAKLKTQSFLISFFNVSIEALRWLLNKLFGRTIDDDHSRSSFYHGYKRENFKKLSTDSITIVGYKASKRVVVILCIMVAIIYAIIYATGLKSGYIDSVFSNFLLAPIHLIMLLWFLDVVLPNVFFIVLNWLIKGRIWAMLKRFEYPT